GKTDSNYNSVTEQAGIFAGKDGFDINVGKNTDLKGAVIASDATPDKNKISTDTLTHSDIQNKADYSASSSGVNYNTGKDVAKKDQGLTPALVISSSGYADSTTKSAISNGTIDIRSNPKQDISNLSRDTTNSVNALGKIFNKKTVQEQQELAQVFGQEVFKAIGDLGLKEGSPEKVALDTFAGGLMSKLGGESFASEAAGGGMNQLVMNELKNIKDPAAMQWASAIVGAVVAKMVGGNAQTGASVAASETKNNHLSHEQYQEMLDELSQCKNQEERDAVNAKWEKIDKEQLIDFINNNYDKIKEPITIGVNVRGFEVVVDPTCHTMASDVLGKDNSTNYDSLFDKMKQWYHGTAAYSFYKQQIAPIGQGLGASIAQNGSWNLVQVDMANGENPRMYYVGKSLGDVAFVVGGTLVTITNGGATIAVSPTGVGAIAGGAATIASGTATLNGVYNFSNDLGKAFSSSGANTGTSAQGSGNAERKLAPNDGKHTSQAKGDISADPFWNDQEKGQQSLNTAYSSDGTKQLYNVSDGKLVKFQPDNVGGWHAYEVKNPAEEVPADVLRQMKNDGVISNAQYNKWIKNK
ncbi:hypothetical protein Ga0466249_004950, partial [Sporomusaceae bacterium BoRhaA]|nr:hypothetical protein [Pelorhabdus rhamnosifermentans]